MKKKDEKSISEIVRDKILVFLVATGCLIGIFTAIGFISYYKNQMEWIVSVSGDNFRLENNVDVFGSDGTYIKTVKCLRKKGGINFTGNYAKYVYTIRGAGVEFHPVINFHRSDHDTNHQMLFLHIDIQRNGDQWDATVTNGDYTQFFEDIENNEISMELTNV